MVDDLVRRVFGGSARKLVLRAVESDRVTHEEDAWHGELDKSAWGCVTVPQVENYKGFIFGNWERRIDASSTPVTRTVPSDSLRQGILKAQMSDGSVQSLNASCMAAASSMPLRMPLPTPTKHERPCIAFQPQQTARSWMS